MKLHFIALYAFRCNSVLPLYVCQAPKKMWWKCNFMSFLKHLIYSPLQLNQYILFLCTGRWKTESNERSTCGITGRSLCLHLQQLWMHPSSTTRKANNTLGESTGCTLAWRVWLSVGRCCHSLTSQSFKCFYKEELDTVTTAKVTERKKREEIDKEQRGAEGFFQQSGFLCS